MAAFLGLPVLVGVIVVLGLLAAVAPRLPARAIAPATAGLCGVAAMLALLLLLSGGSGQLLGGGLAIDALGAFFLLLPALVGFFAACGGIGLAVPGALPALTGAALLLVLAGDARVAVLGLALFTLASAGWAIRPAALGGLFLLAGCFALLTVGVGPGFVAMRAAPPEGWRAITILALALLGLAPLVGWAPWHPIFLARASDHPAVATISPSIGLYLALRILADLCGPVTPAWWGLPFLIIGADSAVAGAITAVRAPVFARVLAGLSMQHAGWMLCGLGVAVIARGSDVLPLATLALGGAMLHALNYTVFGSLGVLSTQAAALAAGGQTLNRLGGLAGRMPIVALGMLVAGSSLAFLPASAGFASGWMLWQALFAVPRLGGLPVQLIVVAVIGTMAVSSGFAVVATLRMAGTGFLGRPRSPRAAAAEDSGRPQRLAVAGLTVICAILGAFPGLALRLVGPAQHWVTAAGLDGQGDWTGLRTQIGSPGYAPLGIVLLLAVALGLVAVLVRHGRLPTAHPVPAWEGGFAAAPAWMPFGDPATQVTADALSGTLPDRSVRLPRLPRIRVSAEWPGSALRQGQLAILILAVLLLMAVIGFGPP